MVSPLLVPTQPPLQAVCPTAPRVLEGVLAGVVVLGGSIASGLVLVASPFDQPIDVDDVGVFDTMTFFGMLVLVSGCTLGFLLLAKSIPDLVLFKFKEFSMSDSARIRHHRTLAFALLVLLFVASCLGTILTTVLVIQPQHTFDTTSPDLQQVVVGAFLSIGFGLLTVLCAGALLNYSARFRALFHACSSSTGSAVRIGLFVVFYGLLL